MHRPATRWRGAAGSKRWGLVPFGLVAALVLTLAWSWRASFGLPLGDSHEGRVLGQFALHIRNFWDLGPSGSSFGADWRPFSDVPYTHHPPFLTWLHLAVSAVFGQGLWPLKAVSYLAGLATVPAFVWVGRRLGFPTLPVVVATAVLVATPFWWVYGRLGLGFLPNLLMVGAIWRAAKRRSRRRATLAGLATAVAVAASWPGVFLAPLLWLWLLRQRGLDRAARRMAVGMFVGAAVVVLWVLQGAGLGELVDHTGTRVGLDRTWGEFVGRQWRFARGLLPWWYLVLAGPALVAGLWDARSRYLTAALTGMVVVFAVVPADNAWRHDYWNFPALMALFPGFAALFTLMGDRLRRLTGCITGRLVEAGVVVAVVAMLVSVAPGDIHDRYFEGPSRAGDLVAAVAPPVGQDTLWHLPEVAWPTWVSYAWDLPPSVVATVDDLATVPGDDRVVVRLDRLPAFVDRSVADEALAVRGTYAVVTGAALRRHLLPE